MLLDEDPATLIHECTSNFHTTSDRDSLARIHSNLATLRASRDYRLAQQTASLKKLSRRLHTLDQQHLLDVSQSNPTEHASEILRLDGLKFKIAKEASDAEIEGERLDGECRRAEAVLGDLEKGVSRCADGENVETDKEVLKLKIYRSLGIQMEPDKEGGYSRAVVRNSDKGTVDIVDVEADVSGTGYAERIWAGL